MGLGEMNRQELMQFLEIAQPDMQKLVKLNNMYNHMKKQYMIEYTLANSLPKHISFKKVIGAFFASLGISFLFYMISLLVYVLIIYFTVDEIVTRGGFSFLPWYWFWGPFFILFIAIIIITNLRIISKRKKALADIVAKREGFNKDTNYFTNEMKVLHDQHPEWRFIPEIYQDPDILLDIYNYLRNMRANNWQEAANLYEFEHPARKLPNYTYQIY